MPARRLAIDRIGGTKTTQYDIFSPDTGQWSNVPTQHGVFVRATWLVARPGKQPTVDALLSDNPGRDFRRLGSSRLLLADWLSVLTRGPMHVMSAGPEPVAALGPASGANVSLSYRTPPVRPEDRTLELKTGYSEADKPPSDPTDAGPIVDIVGPPVLLWAKLSEGKTHIESVVRVNPLPPRRPGGEVTSYPPGTLAIDGYRRTAPAHLARWEPWIAILVGPRAFAVRVIPRPAETRETATPDDVTTKGAGTLRISVPRIVSNADTLVEAFRKADQQPTVSLDIPVPKTSDEISRRDPFQSEVSDLFGAARKQFQYPPTPPVSGVNVFGKMKDLRISDARGKLTVGTEPLVLDATTLLELRDLEGQGDENRHMTIPVKVASNDAQINVDGRADLRINGRSVGARRPWPSRMLDENRLAVLAALAAAFLAAGGVTVRTTEKRQA